MNRLFNLLVAAVLGAGVILIVAVGMARHDRNLIAPFNMFLMFAALAVYLLPAGLAVYRDCKARVWISALDVLFGWTIFGWFVALGLAASGKARPRFMPHPPEAVSLPPIS